MENIKDAIDRELAERKQKNGDLTYVRVPENFVVVDLDIKDENKKAALAFPKTYAELSKSVQGIHLHYYS